MGVITFNHELKPISVVVGGNTFECSLGMTPFGSPSLTHWKPLMVQGGTSVPFELLYRSSVLLSPAQIHTLRACSLLAIPPPPERMPPQGGFPTDLSELNLSGWAALVQDVVAGLLALPPNLGRDMVLPAVALLQLLEVSTGVGFCRYCCRPGLRCTCIGASQQAPPAAWSQVVEQTPGCGVTASSGGMTTPSTSVAGMPGYVAPPPGLTPSDFSSWSLPPPEAPPPRGLPAASQGLSHVGRSIQVRAAVERQARAQLAQGPRGLVHPTQTQPTLALRTPQMAPPLHQPPPEWPATPYQ